MVNTNPQFPHKLKITRENSDEYGYPILDDNGDETIITVLDTVCGLRTRIGNNDPDGLMVKADYLLSVPKHGKIVMKGDNVSFTNTINGEIKTGKIEDANEGNLSAYVSFNQKGNA